MASILTIGRMVLALILLLPPVFSVSFMVLYLLAGMTDILDGWVARKTGTVSERGARMDTVADMIFAAVCLIKILPVMALPTYLWIWVGMICVIKVLNIVSGFVVRRKFVTVHSILNKFTGLLLFLLPLTLSFFDVTYSGGMVCVIATLAAIQEGHRIRTKGKNP